MTKNEINEKSAAATVLTDERIDRAIMKSALFDNAFPTHDALHDFARWIEREALSLAGKAVAAEALAGWKLVPIKLTPEMRAAWDKAPQNEDDDIEFAGAYQAMIEAAPTIRAQVPAAEVRAADELVKFEAVCPDVYSDAERELLWKGWQLAQSSTADKASEVRAAEWISVADRLPEVGQLVMVYSPPTKYDYPGDVNIAFDCIDPNDDDHASWLNHNEHYEHFCCVAKPEGSVGPSAEAPYTHWMPLPTPPSTADSAGTGAMGEGAEA